MNLSNITITGSCKSGLIRPVRTAYTNMIKFLRGNNLGDSESYNSLVDSFTIAGLYDQVFEKKIGIFITYISCSYLCFQLFA